MKNTLKTLGLLLLLPFLLLALKTVLDLRKGATGTPADIVVDTLNVQGSLPVNLWQNLSQGGEEPLDMIKPVIPLLRTLHPQLIRIDHLFDFYNVLSSDGTYDFSRLDQAVNSILATGARPLLSLSYTTNDMSATGQNAGPPKDWTQWSNLVRATAAHYSKDKKIDGIYYEVWNEPDLFGGWKYNKDPNYLTLYTQTARAVAAGATGTNYKVGGPAITGYYSNWIKALFKTAREGRLPLDFISWHRYSKNMADYEKDFQDLNNILSDYPQYFDIERLVTEIGPNGDSDPWYDNSLSGVHLISLSTRMAGKVHRLFTFEPVDGPTSRSDKSTGWGIITHDLKPKPRYFALSFLNLLQGSRLPTSGDGSWVTSLAAKSGNTSQLLLVNYDPRLSHAETFPITFQHLTPGVYNLKTTTYLGGTSTKKVSATANYRQNVYLEPNSAVILELTKAN